MMQSTTFPAPMAVGGVGGCIAGRRPVSAVVAPGIGRLGLRGFAVGNPYQRAAVVRGAARGGLWGKRSPLVVMASSDSAGDSDELVEGVEQATFYDPPKQRVSLMVPLLVGTVAIAGLGVWITKGLKAEQAAKAVTPYESPEDEQKAFEVARARIRQATFVHRALGYQRNRNYARCISEMKMALKENAIARVPILEAAYERTELEQLYLLACQESLEKPPPFQYILQLQEMLGISQAEADKLDEDTPSAGSFSI